MDFDTERRKRLLADRTFTIGGETFTYRASVAPDAIMGWSKMTGGEYVVRDADGKPVRDDDGDVVSLLTEEMAIGIFDETILAFLEPGQEEKWRKIRATDAELPLNLDDLRKLVRWLFEQQTDRPTGPSSGSSNGSGTDGTGTQSTDESRSPAEAAA